MRDFCEAAFGYLGLDYRKHVVVDNLYLRPTELNTLMGDPTKARKVLGWEPSVTFEELVRMMVDSDMELLGGSIGCRGLVLSSQFSVVSRTPAYRFLDADTR